MEEEVFLLHTSGVRAYFLKWGREKDVEFQDDLKINNYLKLFLHENTFLISI